LRFWITKNSEVSVREQLVRQVILAILSEDLPAGQKVPSIRALARRCQIHSNTVSAAYHHLLAQGWLELRRGSGLYVSPRQPSGNDTGGRLEALLTGMLQAARREGYEPDEVLGRLEQLIHPRVCVRVAVVEHDLAMREILVAEVAEHVAVPVEVIEFPDHSPVPTPTGCLVVSLPTRSAIVRKRLAPGTPFLALRLRSVRGSLETQTRPAPDAILAIVSKSHEFRQWAHTMLIAVGLEPDSLYEVDTALANWQERTRAGTLAVTDVVAVHHLPAGCQSRVFRLIADATMAEIREICPA
jgi:DNA-binding transcriptional regulator YhcF (GntR family)